MLVASGCASMVQASDKAGLRCSVPEREDGRGTEGAESAGRPTVEPHNLLSRLKGTET